MNSKAFLTGFSTTDSILAGLSATKRGIVRAAKSTAHGATASVQATKNGALVVADCTTSFVAGAKCAVNRRRFRQLSHSLHSASNKGDAR